MKRIMSIVIAMSLFLMVPFTAKAATATLNTTQFLVNGELKSVRLSYQRNELSSAKRFGVHTERNPHSLM